MDIQRECGSSGLVDFTHRISQQDDEGEDTEHGAEGEVNAIYPCDDEGESPVLLLSKKQAGEQVSDSAEDEQHAEDEVEPFKNRKELFGRRAAFLIFPHLRIIQEGMHEGIVEGEKAEADDSEAGDDKMKNGEQPQMVGVDFALVARSWLAGICVEGDELKNAYHG